MNETDYLIGHIRAALASAPKVGSLDIQVEVIAGRIHLSGEVDCEAKRVAAGEVAAIAAQGLHVVNELKVLTLNPTEPPEVLDDSFGGHR